MPMVTGSQGEGVPVPVVGRRFYIRESIQYYYIYNVKPNTVSESDRYTLIFRLLRRRRGAVDSRRVRALSARERDPTAPTAVSVTVSHSHCMSISIACAISHAFISFVSGVPDGVLK